MRLSVPTLWLVAALGADLAAVATAGIATAIATGCYRPEPQAGARCAADGICPTGLTCRAGICVDPSTPDDGPIVDTTQRDAPLPDARTPDGPDNVGCSDGAREAFTDMQAFPNVAGCAAAWNGAVGMRAAATGAVCGDDIQLCAVPADACSTGWHICGTAGQPTELTSRVSATACADAGKALFANARFATAFSHCSAFDGTTCSYALPLPCTLQNACSEPVCCGPGCRNDAGCPAGAYAATSIAGTTMNGCGMMLATDVTGVICCR